MHIVCGTMFVTHRPFTVRVSSFVDRKSSVVLPVFRRSLLETDNAPSVSGLPGHQSQLLINQIISSDSNVVEGVAGRVLRIFSVLFFRTTTCTLGNGQLKQCEYCSSLCMQRRAGVSYLEFQSAVITLLTVECKEGIVHWIS